MFYYQSTICNIFPSRPLAHKKAFLGKVYDIGNPAESQDIGKAQGAHGKKLEVTNHTVHMMTPGMYQFSDGEIYSGVELTS